MTEEDTIDVKLNLEERKFLKRMCSRAFKFEKMGITTASTTDFEKLRILIEKFKVNDE